MEKPYPYKLLPKYPGMMKRDEVLWDTFVMANPTAFEQVYYNVALGNPYPDEIEKQTAKANGAFEVSQWRIDVLAETKNALYIIENKPNAGAGALGQVLAYRKLFLAEKKPVKPVYMAVLTDHISPILQTAAAKLGVTLLVA